jgi:glycosyltransferase involved in cell wall biosynthesis
MDSGKLTLSVVVISWNQKAFLQRLLGQLMAQNYDHDKYEILIIDDGSSDGSREWLQSLNHANVCIILGNQNRGRGASRNTGIRVAKGRIIVMLDGDHTIQTDFLSVHAGRHNHERCVIVGKSDFADAAEYTALNYYLNRGGAAKLPMNTRLPGRYFLTRNCSVPRDLLLEVGLFDESFLSWGGEDLDLGVRLERSGVPIYSEPQALAIHHHHRNLHDLMDQVYIYGRDSVPILLQRHPTLFYELNLDRTLTTSETPSRFTVLHRRLYCFFFCTMIYKLVFCKAQILRRCRLPRFIFDYLHLRQYTFGYMDYLHCIKQSTEHGNAH